MEINTDELLAIIGAKEAELIKTRQQLAHLQGVCNHLRDQLEALKGANQPAEGVP